MSFMLTTSQMLEETKVVTRRLGWWNLKAGDVVMAVEKGMGLKKGEKVRRLYPIRVVSVRSEILAHISEEDVLLEGFPNMLPHEFVSMFMDTHSCGPFEVVNRIEFRRLREEEK